MAVLNVPLKAIVPLHMDGPNEPIPDGYVIPIGQTLGAADQDINPGGNYTCPDLRNMFLIWGDSTKGAGVAGTAVDNAGGAPGPKGTGGTMAVALSIAELAPHSHTLNRQIISLSSGGAPNYLINVRDEITNTETTNTTGSGTAHENRPRYYALIPIMRVKL